MTKMDMRNVAHRLDMFGEFGLQKECDRALVLLGSVNMLWKNEMMQPSNSVLCSFLIVIGLKLLHMMFSQMFVAMNREMPDPRP